MKYITIYKLMMSIIIISAVNAQSINNQVISGEVSHVNDKIVEIDVSNTDKIQIGDKVNLYHKTSFGNEMEVGEWKVTKVQNNTIMATAVETYVPATVGMLAKIVVSAKKEKVEVLRQDHHNAPSMPNDKDIQKTITSTMVHSQSYVEKAKNMADDLYKNSKNYSKEKTKYLWNEVIENIQKAISLGNAEAYFLLAMVYEDGYGDYKADMKKMIDNIIKSAEHGYVEAQYMLGEMYEDGDEVIKDKDQAVYWYKKAVEQGHEEAKESLDKLLKKEPNIPVQIRGKEPLNYGFGKSGDLNDLLDIEK